MSKLHSILFLLLCTLSFTSADLLSELRRLLPMPRFWADSVSYRAPGVSGAPAVVPGQASVLGGLPNAPYTVISKVVSRGSSSTGGSTLVAGAINPAENPTANVNPALALSPNRAAHMPPSANALRQPAAALGQTQVAGAINPAEGSVAPITAPVTTALRGTHTQGGNMALYGGRVNLAGSVTVSP